MKGHKAKMRPGNLENALGKMYHDCRVLYREYIQNACDSVEVAYATGLLDKKSQPIQITIDKDNRVVVIRDEGIGVQNALIGDVLVDIGNSTKYGTELIGHYGVGRLTAAQYCDRIIFETTAKGESVSSKLVWDTKLAFKLIKEGKIQDGLEIVDEVTEIYETPADLHDHYFKVTLENVYEDSLLDESQVKEYVSGIVPVDFSYEFKEWVWNEAIDGKSDFKALFEKERIYNIRVGKNDIRKPYEPTINKSKDLTFCITKPVFFEISNDYFGKMAWGWFALNEAAQTMNHIPYHGIQLRKKNMAIGSYHYLDQYFKSKVDSGYVIGEIYIIHDDIEPSGSRDGLAANDAVNVFYAELKEEFKKIYDTYTNLSKIGSAGYDKIIDSYIGVNKLETELTSTQDLSDKREIKKKIEAKKQEAQSAAKELESHKKNLDSLNEGQYFIDLAEKRAKQKLEEKIEKENSKKKNHGNKQIKKTTIGQLLEKATPTEADKIGEEEETYADPFAAYKKCSNDAIKVVKAVYAILDEANGLTPDIINAIKTKMVKAITKHA